jgi:hydrogenase expression/formation protein HypC
MCLAIPGRILSVDDTDPLRRGRVDFAGTVKEVSLVYVPAATVGDWVLVHVGFAIQTIDEAEARQVFEYLRQMDALAELDAPGPGRVEGPRDRP